MADIVRTTLGPKSMLKMLLDPMGGIIITNDGNAILREIDVSHPAAKSMLELARSQARARAARARARASPSSSFAHPRAELAP